MPNKKDLLQNKLKVYGFLERFPPVLSSQTDVDLDLPFRNGNISIRETTPSARPAKPQMSVSPTLVHNTPFPRTSLTLLPPHPVPTTPLPPAMVVAPVPKDNKSPEAASVAIRALSVSRVEVLPRTPVSCSREPLQKTLRARRRNPQRTRRPVSVRHRRGTVCPSSDNNQPCLLFCFCDLFFFFSLFRFSFSLLFLPTFCGIKSLALWNVFFLYLRELCFFPFPFLHKQCGLQSRKAEGDRLFGLTLIARIEAWSYPQQEY